MMDKQIDDQTGTETTGHEWDGIKELNTPLPRWWLWTFYACIVFAIGYTIAYPAWPVIGSATTGLLGYTGRGELQGELAGAQQAQSKFTDRIAALPVAQVAADPELSKFAAAAGKSLFKVNCAQCHGSGAAGAPGYPNLNDDDWLWGGTIDQIYTTITHGVRSADAATHFNLMPNFGTDGVLTPDQIVTVAKQVASLSGLEGGASTSDGQQIFSANCVSCHGAQGQGNPSSGVPALNDKIWLYGGTLAQIEAQITQPRHGIMPAWGARLGDTAVKELAVYVHGLGGGQ
ncbi:MAG TPA: cytochrome-c oxidase, cbb3-type subunit III [Devosia sp.]|nr:cytochrome-c oxidase, cbb3-type subunit III [Devosia sp.]